MMNFLKFKLLSLLLSALIWQQLCADDLNLNRHQFTAGIEVSHLERTRTGGTKQKGTIPGLRISYDRLKRNSWYWGAEGAFGQNTLRGHSSTGADSHSRFTEKMTEGRIGYTFQQECGWQVAFTPFVGGGYFEERNNFTRPRELPLHFRIRFGYATAGFLSCIHVGDDFDLGLNVKTRFPYEPKCKISRDNIYGGITQNIKERFQYRIELPLTYALIYDRSFAVTLIPFYEFLHYGAHPGYPYNFQKTKFNIWGATLGMQFCL